MPCDTRLVDPNQTIEERASQVGDALRKLEQALASGSTKMAVGRQGGVAFDGWRDRAGVSDACAFRLLKLKGSWPMRQALARAEAQAGRKVDERAVLAGVHSHDGGKTWGRD